MIRAIFIFALFAISVSIFLPLFFVWLFVYREGAIDGEIEMDSPLSHAVVGEYDAERAIDSQTPETVKYAQETWLYAQTKGYDRKQFPTAEEFPTVQAYVDHCVARLVENCIAHESRGPKYVLDWSDGETEAREALEKWVKDKSSRCYRSIRIVPVQCVRATQTVPLLQR